VSAATPLARVLARLPDARPSGEGYSARCPAHDDQHASLSIRTNDHGDALLNCHAGAGCPVEKIVTALRLTMADLFADAGRRNGHAKQGEGRLSIPRRTASTLQPPASGGLTLAQYGAAKQLPVAFLQGLGLQDISYLGAPAVRIPYLGPDGTEGPVRFRLGLEGADRFKWRTGSKPTPYGLWRLRDARAAGYAVIVEGESDTHTLWHHGEPALGIPGANNWREEWAAVLADLPTIYILLEPDQGGAAVQDWLAKSALRDRAWLVRLGAHKDPSALHCAMNGDTAAFRAAWQAALEAALPWSEQARAEVAAQTAAAWTQCAELAQHSRILDVFACALATSGVAGEARAVKLLYLVLTSRLLARPVAAAVKGPSSAGKSYLTERVVACFPATAIYALSAMSERALAYSEEPLAHRVLVIYEAAGLTGDFASYLVRSLLSEGKIRYETVEKTKDGLRARLIEREGPTGLLVTTTAVRLHPENETRLLSIPITDTPEQTKAVFAALAAEDAATLDVAPWHALQTWLEGQACAVSIPYRGVLADTIPPVATRLRRDFGAVLNLIAAHALLHQANRARDARGRIVATLDDYAAVRELVADLVADGAEATISPTVRETVHAIAQLVGDTDDETTVAAVARILELDKAAALRRIRVAVERGYVVNRQERKGRPARLVLGDPLSKDVEILPDPGRLQGCVVAGDSGGESIHPPPGVRTAPQPDAGGQPVVGSCVQCGNAAAPNLAFWCLACLADAGAGSGAA
jgi:hypothetical protein